MLLLVLQGEHHTQHQGLACMDVVVQAADHRPHHAASCRHAACEKRWRLRIQAVQSRASHGRSWTATVACLPLSYTLLGRCLCGAGGAPGRRRSPERMMPPPPPEKSKKAGGPSWRATAASSRSSSAVWRGARPSARGRSSANSARRSRPAAAAAAHEPHAWRRAACTAGMHRIGLWHPLQCHDWHMSSARLHGGDPSRHGVLARRPRSGADITPSTPAAPRLRC